MPSPMSRSLLSLLALAIVAFASVQQVSACGHRYFGMTQMLYACGQAPSTPINNVAGTLLIFGCIFFLSSLVYGIFCLIVARKDIHLRKKGWRMLGYAFKTFISVFSFFYIYTEFEGSGIIEDIDRSLWNMPELLLDYRFYFTLGIALTPFLLSFLLFF